MLPTSASCRSPRGDPSLLSPSFSLCLRPGHTTYPQDPAMSLSARPHEPPAMRPVSPVPLTVHVPVQPPDVSNGALGPYAVPYDRLVGTWHVVASTLPLCASLPRLLRLTSARR